MFFEGKSYQLRHHITSKLLFIQEYFKRNTIFCATFSWEQRKLSNLAFISKGQQLGKSEMLADGAFYVLNGGQTPSGYTNRCNTDANTISISEGGNSCGFVIYNKQKFWSGAHNYTLTSLKSVDQVFLFEALKGLEKNLMALRVGTGLPNIQKPALQSFIIGFPSFEEQKAIGRLLVNVDYSVVLHQRKLEELQKLKKSLLQKMFI
jgi:type I restriction enzyme S subunit